MQSHFNHSDLEFLRLFTSCELNPEVFTHEAHLRLAWINIDKYGIESAENEIQNHLKKFVAHVGARDKYNKTVTIAAMKAVYHFMLKSDANNFKDFISEFPRLNHNFKELLETHYSFDIFNSDRAKMEFLSPDLIPFD
jgi:hypothetical protein